MITNYDLLFHPSQRTDFHYIVTKSPFEGKDGITIQVDLEGQESATLDGYDNMSAISVSDIRSGKLKDLWLLSGGTVIMDDAIPRHIAIGIRDANAADPFTYTNIGAGRCDQKLFDHCIEEFETEFILCLKNKNKWHQVKWGEKTPFLPQLKKPDIQMEIKTIFKFNEKMDFPFEQMKLHPHMLLSDHHDLFQKVTILWGDFEEILHGYVWIDTSHHTTEFRLPVCCNLTPFNNSITFFGEGTGYAVWKTVKQIQALVAIEEQWGAALVTPFLKKFVSRLDW